MKTEKALGSTSSKMMIMCLPLLGFQSNVSALFLDQSSKMKPFILITNSQTADFKQAVMITI